MSAEPKTAPSTDDGTLTHWPPLVHLVKGEQLPVKRGDRALCGAKLMGISMPDARDVCEKCAEIARGMAK